jgi:hypothetical protein
MSSNLGLYDTNLLKVKVKAAEDLFVDESKEVRRVLRDSVVEFRIPSNTKLIRLKKRYCEEYHLHAAEDKLLGIVFKFGARTIQDSDTCSSLAITTGDTIKVQHSIDFHCLTSSSLSTQTLAKDLKNLFKETLHQYGSSSSSSSSTTFLHSEGLVGTNNNPIIEGSGLVPLGSPDIVFVVGDERIPAHSVILCARSEKMRAMCHFSDQQQRNRKFPHEIVIAQHDPYIFKLMLEWIYCDEIDVPPKIAMQLLTLAEEMLLFPLKARCERILMGWVNKDTAVKLFICADTYRVDFLKQKCKQFIIDNYEEMLKQQPHFDRPLCQVPELLLELTRSALCQNHTSTSTSSTSALSSPLSQSSSTSTLSPSLPKRRRTDA